VTCRQCGTEIADKALICYRCGTPTTEAKFKPVELHDRPSLAKPASLAVFLVLALAGAYLAATAETSIMRTVGLALVIVSVLLSGRRLLARGR
jgi:zinc-ribbon domain